MPGAPRAPGLLVRSFGGCATVRLRGSGFLTRA